MIHWVVFIFTSGKEVSVYWMWFQIEEKPVWKWTQLGNLALLSVIKNLLQYDSIFWFPANIRSSRAYLFQTFIACLSVLNGLEEQSRPGFFLFLLLFIMINGGGKMELKQPCLKTTQTYSDLRLSALFVLLLLPFVGMGSV